jgi:hypothetical protein
VDGNPNTFWSPSDNLPHWFKVDLQKPADISGMKFTFWKAGVNTYRIEISADGENWKTVVQTNSIAESPMVQNDFSATGIRFVRVWLLGSTRAYNWPGISELAVFAHGENVALGKPATADDFQARTDASKAVDGDFSTAWTIDSDKLPQSLTVDLDSPTNFNGVRILWESAGVAHRYRIETSTDEAVWKTVVDQADNTKAVSQPEHRFQAKGVHYVRVTLTGYDDMGGSPRQSMHPWPGIREIEIFK